MNTTPSVILQSITGVDVELRIAGPGSRSYAFVIDWHIRGVLALAWWFTALIMYGGGLPFFFGEDTPRGSGYFFIATLPPLVIYFLYHPILEIAMHGRTPGKRIAGVRLVSRTGDIPSPGALLVRNVFRIIDSLPIFYLIGLACVMFTSQHVRIGDLAAGTLLVLDGAESDKSFGSLATSAGAGGLSPQAADLAHELLDRWNALDEPTRANLARSLIARIDPSTTAAALTDETAAQLQAHLRTLLAQGKPA